MKVSWLSTAVLGATAANALDVISTKGNKFFDEKGNQFFMKGVWERSMGAERFETNCEIGIAYQLTPGVYTFGP